MGMRVGKDKGKGKARQGKARHGRAGQCSCETEERQNAAKLYLLAIGIL